MNRFLNTMLVSLVIFAFALPALANNPFDAVERRYERWKLKKNIEDGADHDIDCEVVIRNGAPYCEIHRSADLTRCPTIATGNFNSEGEWTACDPTLTPGGDAFCAAHDRYDCPLLATWQPEEPVQPGVQRADCNKVYKQGRAYCSRHDTFTCFALRLPCRVHAGQQCGAMRPGSIERPGMVPKEDGVLEKSLLFLKSTHTAYVWANP